jgi:hypothetical protein
MTLPADGRLYRSLPAVYRIRDSEQGEPLRRFLKVIEEELQGIEDDVEGLFENWFIETCEEWVVPYIGDLLGVQGLYPGTPESFSLRAHVANTLAYRRRKGTAAVLEQVATDTTGWRARAIEAFQRLAVSAHVNHPRTDRPGVLSVRGIDALQYVGGPFDVTQRSVDVRHVASGRGRWNLPHVALWLWRLQVLETEGAQARALGNGRWSLDPWAWRSIDGVQLFNRARTETSITDLAQPAHVPGPLLRLPLYREVESVVAGGGLERVWFPDDGQEPVVRVRYLLPGGDRYAPDSWREVVLVPMVDPPGSIPTVAGLAVCHLGERDQPFEPNLDRLRGWLRDHDRVVGLDPVSGRLLFREGLEPDEVRADIATAVPGRLGGGAYRADEGFDLGADAPTFLVFVTRERAPTAFPEPGHNWRFASLSDAVEAWERHLEVWRLTDPDAWRREYRVDGARGVIVLSDSTTYEEGSVGDLSLVVPASCRLSVVSARWGQLKTTTADLHVRAVREQVVRELVPGGIRPHVRGNIVVLPPPPEAQVTEAIERGRLTLHGLHLEGSVSVLAGALDALSVAHATVAPASVVTSFPRPALSVLGGVSATTLSVVRSVVLGVEVGDVVDTTIDASVLDAGAHRQPALNAPDAMVSICSSTVRGQTLARTLSASNTLFTGVVDAKRRQEGCVRFSFVPDGSRTPRRFHCQPDLAVGEDLHDDVVRAAATARMFPSFVLTAVGDPAYFQLASGTADEILTGAEDGAEMGVWHHLRQPQRLANLRSSLVTYLRFGLEAGGFFAT